MNKALTKARKAAGLSKTQLEALAGLRTGTIYDLENGRRTKTAYDAAARILGVLERYGVPQPLRDCVFPVGDVAGARR